MLQNLESSNDKTATTRWNEDEDEGEDEGEDGTRFVQIYYFVLGVTVQWFLSVLLQTD